MYILTDINNDCSYVAKCLSPLSLIVGCTTQTLRNWLKSPDIALNRGYIVKPAKLLKTRHKVNRIN